MKIDEMMVDSVVLKELGRRLSAVRLQQNISQKQLAEQAGLGLRTVQRLEQGAAATQLSGFIRVCRILGLISRIDQLITEPAPSPIEQLRNQEGRRRRSSRRRKPAVLGEEKWTWGKSS